MTRDEVDARFTAQVAADYTNDEYALLVRLFHRPWVDVILKAGGGEFLQVWRRNVSIDDEIVLDGLATSIESQTHDR